MLEQKVEAFLNRHSLSFSGQQIMIGVSGGRILLSVASLLYGEKENNGT